MGRQMIELVQVLVDRIEDAAARQQKDFRHLDEEIDRRKAAEKDRDHWRQARQEAIEAGELMKAEIETLRQQLDKANFAVTLQRAVIERLNKFAWKVRWADCYTETLKALAELDAQPAPVAETAEGGT